MKFKTATSRSTPPGIRHSSSGRGARQLAASSFLLLCLFLPGQAKEPKRPSAEQINQLAIQKSLDSIRRQFNVEVPDFPHPWQFFSYGNNAITHLKEACPILRTEGENRVYLVFQFPERQSVKRAHALAWRLANIAEWATKPESQDVRLSTTKFKLSTFDEISLNATSTRVKKSTETEDQILVEDEN